MNVGVCRIELELPGSRSLKDKRRAVRSIVDRVRNRFNVRLRRWTETTVGRRLRSASPASATTAAHANEMLSRVVRFVEGCREDAVLAGYDVEVVTGV